MSQSQSQGPTEPALLEATIGATLARTAARLPDGEALVSRHQDLRWTWSALDRDVDDLAAGLVDAGLCKGDRLGIWSPNCAEWVLLQLATARAGVVLVTINPAYRTSELEHALRQSGCRWVVAAPSFKTSDYVAMMAEVAPALPDLERTVYLGSPEWEALTAAGRQVGTDGLRAREAELMANDPINIQFTSGTTGFPKGATLSHRNILNNGYLVGHGCRYTDADRVCIPVPFYHCFGMVMGNLACVAHGACMVIPEASFDPQAVLDTVAAERCTSLYGVPTMFIAILEHPAFAAADLSSLRTGIMAGSPCPVEVMTRVVNDMGMTEVTICYGMTETSPVSTQTSPDDPLDRRVSTVGRVHPHVEIRVADPETGETTQVGEPGELCTRGYSVMAGYWNDPERTAEAIDAEGWMHTGDLATMDAEGFVNIVGRSKDMIIRGGENVYPREIEEFLYGHPGIVDVQVVGVPDLKYGEQIVAWVKLREGAAVGEDDVKAYCQGRIAHYKVPRYVLFADDFPMTVTGKVQKYLLRERAIQELGLQAAAEVRTA